MKLHEAFEKVVTVPPYLEFSEAQQVYKLKPKAYNNDLNNDTMYRINVELSIFTAGIKLAGDIDFDITWIDAQESGEFDTVYKCPKCGAKTSVQAEDTRDSLTCACGFSGPLRVNWSK